MHAASSYFLTIEVIVEDLKNALSSTIRTGVTGMVLAEDLADSDRYNGSPMTALVGIAVNRLRRPCDKRPDAPTRR